MGKAKGLSKMKDQVKEGDMQAEQLKQLVVDSLEELKGRDISVLDVREMTGVTDYMVVCSGTSNRHVKSLANNVSVNAKDSGAKPIGVEGEREGEWVLVDFGDVVAHVMLPETRMFYDIEKLWEVPATIRANASEHPLDPDPSPEDTADSGTEPQG